MSKIFWRTSFRVSRRQMRRSIKEMAAFVDKDVFWRFENEHANEIIGHFHEEDGVIRQTTVREEYEALIGMITRAVVQYNRIMAIEDKSKIPNRTYRTLVKLTENAEMKALWLNRVCHEKTGKYFFSKVIPVTRDRFFYLQDVFGLVYNLAAVC